PIAATSATENATIATEPTEAPTEKETTAAQSSKDKNDDKDKKDEKTESKSEDSSSSGAASGSSDNSGNDNTASAKNTSVNNSSNNTSSNKAAQNSSNNTNSGSSNKSNTSSSSAQTSKVWHEAVYKYVEHPAETKKVWVVDVPASTKEEPVYEEQDRTICNTCGADITDCVDDHMYNHVINGENGSYRNEWVNVQVGTKTVTVPEQGHYETQTVKKAWTEKILVREAGYY
ncbi:MAG: hypothetical protein ACI4I4_00345, partial [Acutalibacteraceae bacterium]